MVGFWVGWHSLSPRKAWRTGADLPLDHAHDKASVRATRPLTVPHCRTTGNRFPVGEIQAQTGATAGGHQLGTQSRRFCCKLEGRISLAGNVRPFCLLCAAEGDRVPQRDIQCFHFTTRTPLPSESCPCNSERPASRFQHGHQGLHAVPRRANGSQRLWHRPKDFDDLIRILDSEIRLITPTDPEGKEAGDDAVAQTKAGQKYFKLTHDYLVHSLRDWLT